MGIKPKRCCNCKLFKRYKLQPIVYPNGREDMGFGDQFCDGKNPRLAPERCPEWKEKDKK